MEAIGTQQYEALFSAHLQSSHTGVVLLTDQVSICFLPMRTAENPANKNLIIHSKIIQLLNKNLKTNISASEWMTLVSAVIPLLDSECDSALPGPLQFLCFLGAVKKMAKCALSGENVHQWLQG